MAGTKRLTDGTNTVDFSPRVEPGIRRPDARTRGWHQYDGGPRQYWDASGGFREDFKLEDITKTRADQLNTWWQNLTILVFTEDLDAAPGDTIFSRINPAGGRPFQWEFGKTIDTKFEATVTIVEVSSSSSA